jgi:hypothetical protein
MNDKVKKTLANISAELARIPQDDLNDFVARLQRHADAARLDAHHSVRSALQRGISCARTDLLVLSGRDTTVASGTATLTLDPLLCGAVSEGLGGSVQLIMIRQPTVVATVHGANPAFATVATSATVEPAQTGFIVNDRGGAPVDEDRLVDVKVEVRTWKHDGSAAPHTLFSWICTVEAARRILIGG